MFEAGSVALRGSACRAATLMTPPSRFYHVAASLPLAAVDAPLARLFRRRRDLSILRLHAASAAVAARRAACHAFSPLISAAFISWCRAAARHAITRYTTCFAGATDASAQRDVCRSRSATVSRAAFPQRHAMFHFAPARFYFSGVTRLPIMLRPYVCASYALWSI